MEVKKVYAQSVIGFACKPCCNLVCVVTHLFRHGDYALPRSRAHSVGIPKGERDEGR